MFIRAVWSVMGKTSEITFVLPQLLFCYSWEVSPHCFGKPQPKYSSSVVQTNLAMESGRLQFQFSYETVTKNFSSLRKLILRLGLFSKEEKKKSHLFGTQNFLYILLLLIVFKNSGPTFHSPNTQWSRSGVPRATAAGMH